MIIKSSQISSILYIIEKLSNKKFNIQTQYKFLKIKQALEQEELIYQDVLFKNIENYFEKDDNGNIITDDKGGCKIQKEYIDLCNQEINQLNNLNISLPDIYFSTDELNELGLTLKELEILMPFIK